MREGFTFRGRTKRPATGRIGRCVALLLVGVLFIGTDSVLAQRVLFNNNSHIPDSIRNQVSAWDSTPGGYCAGTRLNSQHIWLSPPNNPRAAGVLSMARGSTTLPVWFNAVATNCLANVRNDGTGRIITQDLKHTRYNLQSATVTITPAAPGALSVSLPGTPDGDARNPLLSYQQTYDVAPPNLRYVKNWGNRDSPAHHVQLTLSGTGLSNLPVGDYTVRVTARAKLVNHFQPPASASIYECVYNQQTFTNNTRDGLNRCAAADAPATFTLQVRENWAGRCNVTLRAGTSYPLTPGQQFGVRFSATNTGLGSWVEGEVAMRRQSTTTPRWQIDDNVTPNRLIPFGTIRVLPPEVNTMWNTSATAFTAPATSGTWTFDLVKHGGSPTSILNTCTLNLTVDADPEPENRPYMHINGGDVYSGASFEHTTPERCTPTSRAVNSPIQTNGFSDEWNPSSNVWQSGTSQSQYAVFASGVIGDGESPSTNTFLGNYGYHTRPREGSDMNPLRDVLFANQGADRGSYYAGAGVTIMPCVGDIGDIEALIAEGGPEIYTGGSWGELVDFIGDDRNGIMVVAEADVEAYFGSPGDPSPGVDILPGVRKIIIVDGNLHIQGNIEYPGTYNSLADIPYVQFIARGGNIYLDHHVTRHIDAHLMALPRIAPDGTQTRGIIDTCATLANRGQWVTPMHAGMCYKQPTPGIQINGSMIARRIYWKNTSGTLGRSGEYITDIPNFTGPDGVCSAGVAGVGGSARSPGRYAMCAAELVNFYPEVHLRHYQGSVPNTYGNVPVSTQELPPIY